MIQDRHADATRLERDLGRRVQVSWPMLAWVAVIVVTLLTRLWDLGDRAMSHDESLHTYYSWKLFMGEGYVHDPMMHGPLLYHATALSYFLFGASDLTARLLAVVTGLALVLSPLILRKWLGNVGALATGVMLLLSPSVMYYSRYIRHDIPVELFTVLLFAAFIRFVDERSGRWLVVAGVALAGAVTSAEMSYINIFVLTAFVITALFVEKLSQRAAGLVEPIMAVGGILLLVYAGLASAGRISGLEFATEGSAARVSMQLGFLISGMMLIYALVSPLLARPRPGASSAVAEPGPHLGEVLPHALGRAVNPSGASLRLAAAGAVMLAAGALLARAQFLLPDAPALARFTGLGVLLLGVGWFAGLVGVIGRLAPSAGRHADAAAAAVGALCAVIWGALWAQAGGPAGLIKGPGLGSSPTHGALLLLCIASFIVAAYALIGWLIKGRGPGGLAASVAAAPLEALGVGLAVFLVIYTLLFTTFFTNSAGIYGFVDSIRYWLKQHDVVRGGQPWYYYGLLAPMYELLPLTLALAAVVVYGLRREWRVGMGNDDGDPNTPTAAAWAFVPGLIAWSAGVFWIYSWAGEKMPWLLVHLVVPMTFLGGRLFGDFVRRVDWARMRSHGWMVAGLFVVLLLAVAGWASVAPFGGQSQQALSRTSGFLIGIPAVLLIVWALWRAAEASGRRLAWSAVGLAAIMMLLAWNLRTTLAANFINDELATEYIVYAHGTPDDKEVYEILHEMQERVGIDTQFSVGYDDEVSWPWTWYFRHTEFPGAVYIGKKPTSVLTHDAVLVGSPNYGNFEPYLRDRYVDIEYRRMWWPNEGYKGLTPAKVLEGVRDPRAWRSLVNVLLYRKYTTDPSADVPEAKSLTDWYHHANMKLYVKRDLIQRLWPLVQARPDWLPETPQEVEAPSRSVSGLTIEQTYETGPDGQPILMPKGIALDESGRLFVVDFGQDRIVVFDADGKAVESIGAGDLTYVGQEGNVDHSAWGVCASSDGAVYVADTWNHRVVKYVNGRQRATFGQFGNPSSASVDLEMLFGPRDIAVGLEGNLFVTDTGNDRIIVLTPDLTPIRAIGGSGIDLGQFDEPTSVAFDPETGDLYVADQWNFRIQRFDRDLNPVAQWAVDGWESQEAAHKAYIASRAGLVVVSDPAAQRVWVFDRDGKTLATLDLPADSRGLDQPIGVEVDEQGRIYVASSNSSLVTRYAPLAELTAPGEDGEAAADAESGAAEEGVGEDGEGGGSVAGPGEGEPEGDGAVGSGEGVGEPGEDQPTGGDDGGETGSGREGERAAPRPTATSGAGG